MIRRSLAAALFTALFTALASSGLAAQTAAVALPLIPAPREASALPAFAVGRGVTVDGGTHADDRFAAGDLTDVLRARGVSIARSRATAGVTVRLLRRDSRAGQDALRRAGLAFDSAMVEEGYVLVAQGGRIDVIGASAAGVYYGAQTVKQLVERDGPGARVLGARVRDWPAMRWRGLHDDWSRGPLPTLDYQKRQIRTLAAHKVNVYSPYLENVFAYASHPLLGAPLNHVTPAEARELAGYARRHHVEVIPEQQTFGHLHTVLRLEKYSPLAERAHGHALAPDDPRALDFVRSTFAELDSAFGGRFLHVGGDETFELGRGRTAARIAREGLGPTYVDYVTKVVSALRPLNRRLLLWGDVGTNHPELVASLPKDLVAVPWMYDNVASAERWIKPFRDAGMETWVAPGVNNWWRVYPNLGIALPNIRLMAREGQRLGAVGLLNTTWDDFGEQLFESTWSGVLFGAAAGWQSGDSDPDAFLRAYPRAFLGDTTGHVEAAERDLMAASAIVARAAGTEMNEQVYWMDPWSDEGRRLSARMLPVASELRLRAESAIEHVARARRGGAVREPGVLDAMELGARRLDLIGMKFQLAHEIAAQYAQLRAQARDSAGAAAIKWFDLADLSGINGRLQDLRDVYVENRVLYDAAWRRENRAAWLPNVLARFDLATQLWVARIDRMNQVRAEWARTRRLPPPADLGMPDVPVAPPATR
ncbi:MAG: glycoside hydrolase family 20 zincin-like fold domain-containing protein [Gemmatirosa sp.]